VLVVPRGVLPRVRYGAVAIALALSLWSSGEPGWQIRDEVSALPSLGEEKLHGWRSLCRWARCASTLWRGVRDGPAVVAARAAAERVAAQLAAHAPMPTGDRVTDASEGALIA
jgi:hypothetical protein